MEWYIFYWTTTEKTFYSDNESNEDAFYLIRAL